MDWAELGLFQRLGLEASTSSDSTPRFLPTTSKTVQKVGCAGSQSLYLTFLLFHDSLFVGATPKGNMHLMRVKILTSKLRHEWGDLTGGGEVGQAGGFRYAIFERATTNNS